MKVLPVGFRILRSLLSEVDAALGFEYQAIEYFSEKWISGMPNLWQPQSL